MSVTYDYTGKVAVITGAATGLGRAMALAFAKSGANVAVCDFNPEEGQKTTDDINALGAGKAVFCRCDVRSDEEIAATKDKVLSEFGTVDILINNAGVGPGTDPQGKAYLGPPFTNVVIGDWHRVLDINLGGTVRMIQAFYDVFAAKKEGKIINTSSIAAFNPSPLQPHYSASKIAVISLTQSLSIELGAYNVNINAICPGFVYTPIYHDGGMHFKNARPAAFEDCEDSESVMNKLANSMSAMKRPQTAEDMADAALFLASDAAKEMTGQYINVDSGIIFR